MKNSALFLSQVMIRMILIVFAGLQASTALASVDRVDYSYHCAGIGTSKGMKADVVVGASVHGYNSARMTFDGGVLNGRALKASQKSTNVSFQLPSSGAISIEYHLLYGGRRLHSGHQGGYLKLRTAIAGNAKHYLFSCTRNPLAASVTSGDNEYAWVR